jgi:serine/threonine protein kinase
VNEITRIVTVSIARKLLGQILEGRWTLVSERRPPPTASGGCFSHGFIARGPDGEEAFVKVLDIRLNGSHSDPLKDLEIRIQRFNYEADIARACADDRLSRVAHAIAHGVLRVGPDGSEAFPYLVFERAAGDLRDQIARERQLPPWVCFGVLHNVAVAIRQLHAKNIAHQDVKPSNVLDYRADGHKLGDFGSAHVRARARPGPILPIAGDPTYAPPEQLYRYHVDDWVWRRLMGDVYHLGSLALFLLTGEGATARLARQLAPEHHWEVWTGSTDDLLPILRHTVAGMVDEVLPEHTNLDPSKHAELTQILRYLLEPDPRLRGYPADRSEGVPNGMQRLISKFYVFSEAARLRGTLQGRR